MYFILSNTNVLVSFIKFIFSFYALKWRLLITLDDSPYADNTKSEGIGNAWRWAWMRVDHEDVYSFSTMFQLVQLFEHLYRLLNITITQNIND